MNKDIHKLINKNVYELARTMVTHKEPFKLIIWNNDDWDRPLPDYIMMDYPEHIVLDLESEEFEDCFVNESKEIVLNIYFADDPYTKILKPEDIVGVFTIQGEAISVNTKYNKITNDITRSDILRSLQEVGINKLQSVKSLDSFLENLPSIKKILK